MEVIMPAQSSMDLYFNWAKDRIDEMNATLASLEAKSKEMHADSRTKATQFIADLYKRRGEFRKVVKNKKENDTSEADWLRAKSQLENTWNGFEGEVKKYEASFR
jgi:hypothetical protein